MRSSIRKATIVSCVAVLLPLLGSCNPYDLMMHDRFEQAAFDGDVDILWVVDNSNSMARIQDEVRQNFDAFISAFANVEDDEGQELDYDTVQDATIAWAEYLMDRERFLHYNMGVVTTDMDGQGNGQQGNIRARSVDGNILAIGDPIDCEGDNRDLPEVLDRDDAREGTLVDDFRSLVDVGVSGSTDEAGLYSAAVAMCKGKPQSWWDNLENLPDTDPVRRICSNVAPAHQTCNDGFFREGASSVVIVVTDEGDNSAHHTALPPSQELQDCITAHNEDPFYGECDCRLSWWLDFFLGIGQPVVFANIGPTYQLFSDDTAWCDGSIKNFPGPCNPFGAGVCAMDFYQQSACLTRGLFTPMEETATPDEPATCEAADFEKALTDIGALISNLSRGWRLSVIPDPDTIVVVKNESEIVPRVGDGETVSGGWQYRPQTRSIAFQGDWIPSYEDIIDVYYHPQFDRTDQVGRPLPY
jgi:hypothetical protein